MSKIKNVVKVMNFHSLLRVDKARKEAEKYRNVGDEITNIIGRIVYNKNMILDKNVLLPIKENPKLNIYLANDFGFCGNFNSVISKQIKQDVDDYKIIIGNKIIYTDDKVLLKISKDHFYQKFEDIEKCINEALTTSSYSEINLYYNHYNSSTSFDFKKLTLFPIEFSGEYYEGEDFVKETDVTSMLKSLLAFYICYELRMSECNSRAAENVLRSQITKQAIEKIDEKEEERLNTERRKRTEKSISKTVENFKKLMWGEFDEQKGKII